MSIGLQTVFIQLPGLIQLAAIATFVLTGGEADPAVIFTSIMFFQLLQQPVTQMPNALSQIAQLLVGLARIGNFLKTDEQLVADDGVRKPGSSGAALMHPSERALDTPLPSEI